jgi:hypothetical protein
MTRIPTLEPQFKYFYLGMVKPTVQEFWDSPRDIRRGRIAAIMLHQTTDYWWLEFGSSLDGTPSDHKLGTLRSALIDRCPEYSLIWDVADAVKHAKLEKSNRSVRHSNDVTQNPGIFGAPFGTSLFGDATVVEIRCQNGTVRPLVDAVRAVSDMWDALLDDAEKRG